MDVYRRHIPTIGRPDDRTEKSLSSGYPLAPYQALFLRDCLREYAAYQANTELKKELAIGYIEYIEHIVFEEQRTSIELYFHNDTAVEVLSEAATSETVFADPRVPLKSLEDSVSFR